MFKNQAREVLNHKIVLLRAKINNLFENNVIKSPIDGQVNLYPGIASNTFLNEKTSLFKISPHYQKGNLLTYSLISSENIGKIHHGMPVNIYLSDYPVLDFGIITGSLSHVSELTTSDRYKARIDLHFPLQTSYKLILPHQKSYLGNCEVNIGKTNLYRKIGQQIKMKSDKYLSN